MSQDRIQAKATGPLWAQRTAWCGEKALIRGKGRAHEDPGTLAPLDDPEQWSVKATPSLALSTALHDHRPYPPSSLGDLEK